MTSFNDCAAADAGEGIMTVDDESCQPGADGFAEAIAKLRLCERIAEEVKAAGKREAARTAWRKGNPMADEGAMKMKLTQTICVPLDSDRDVLVISKGATRHEDDGGQHIRIKVVEGDTVAQTEISLSTFLDLIQDAIR